MKIRWYLLLCATCALFLTACSGQEPAPMEVTGEVPVTVEVLKEVEVTRIVTATVPASEEAESPAALIQGTEVMTLSSTTTGQEYRIYIGFPDGYDPTPTNPREYRALVLLDANYWFPAATAITRKVYMDEEIDQLIVVGVGYPTDDLDQIALLRQGDMLPSAAGGGSVKFLAFLRDELIPYLEANYPIMPGRHILAGHSFGGLFVLDALLQDPELFDAYLAMSPGLWFGDRVAFDLEAAYAKEHDDLPAALFMSVGEREPETYENMELRMVTNLIEFHGILQDRGYEGLEMELAVLEAVNHNGSFPGALVRGLTAVME